MPIIAPLSRPALLALSNGTVFRGLAIGASGSTAGEIAFHTTMTGYQEVLTSPASYQQIVAMTYPMVGGAGLNSQDNESERIWAAGLVIRQLPVEASNWRKEQSLEAFLKQSDIIAIEGVDTREITNIVREEGMMGACIMAASHPGEVLDVAEAIEQAKAALGVTDRDLTQEVSTKEIYQWEEGEWDFSGFDQPACSNGHLCVVDLGLKKALLRAFAQKGYAITVVPANTTADELLALQPDGIIFSDGPGYATACKGVIGVAAALIQQKVPLFGIGIGHQIIALAAGANLVKLKSGHHGANHPVSFEQFGYSAMSLQNQRYAIEANGLSPVLLVDQVSLFDQSIQGVCGVEHPILTTQGYPDVVSAPRGTVHVFDRFLSLI